MKATGLKVTPDQTSLRAADGGGLRGVHRRGRGTAPPDLRSGLGWNAGLRSRVEIQTKAADSRATAKNRKGSISAT